MGHRIFKRCPFCSHNHETYLKLPLQLESGDLDESSDICLNDPFALAEYYSSNGLDELIAEARALRWVCPKRQADYVLLLGPLDVLGLSKLDRARWVCGEVVRVQVGSP